MKLSFLKLLKHKFVELLQKKIRNLVTANGTAALEFAELILKGLEFDSKENIERQIYMYQRGFYEYCNKYGNPYQ
ncbi:hypothetical protein WOC45_08620 [Staphylococcus aureus]|uniref:hypothetical protein n=1 Tax=Staphylococcus aureus TaxID=1280 RepID=UPI00324B1C1D